MVILYGPTALRYLRMCRSSRTSLRPASTAHREAEPPHSRLYGELCDLLGEPDPHFVVMVTSSSQKRSHKRIRVVVDSGKFPKGSFCKLAPFYGCPVPELAFLQMANCNTLVGQIVLGFELCGSYTLDGDRGAAYKVPPSTSIKKLAQYCGRASLHGGSKKALRAIRYVEDGSASPQETSLYLMLCLPCRLGGFGFPRGTLNGTVDVSSVTQVRYREDLRRCDILWEREKVAIEYESTEFHSGSEKLEADAARRTLLQAAGFSVVTVTRNQLRSLGGVRRVAEAVLKLTKWRINPRIPDYAERQRALFNELFPFW